MSTVSRRKALPKKPWNNLPWAFLFKPKPVIPPWIRLAKSKPIPRYPHYYMDQKFGKKVLYPRLPYHFEPQIKKDNLSNFGAWLNQPKKKFKQKPWTHSQRLRYVKGFGDYYKGHQENPGERDDVDRDWGSYWAHKEVKKSKKYHRKLCC